ncbi:uncharacterized protein LOC109824377 isoform X2 [Asparagus officinalis]|uniref:uncharacterized protein LOC109824377 isoform X2 n=1 Tax=Asparagus officinalis TaxID=4686 RepID=UPI00098E26C6|nr:uncharacterized protein LOC109824377 isoform X2 [Asparagus officinalis]
MSMTQFAMVEELASLIKDNLSCKHLVLSVEEALVNFLQDDASQEGFLELQPMIPYHRMLLHRLADIYGPSILVSDILWQHDEYQFPTPSPHILRRKEAPELKKNETFPPSTSLEEREAAYMAARARIFSLHESDQKEVTAPKSRNIPVVARRMIAHALGTKISSNASTEAPETKKESEEHVSSSSEHYEETTTKLHRHRNKTYDRHADKSSRSSNGFVLKKGDTRADDLKSSLDNPIPKGNNGKVVTAENLERQQKGAAKRIFAHALGLTSGRGNQSSSLKSNQGNSACGQNI